MLLFDLKIEYATLVIRSWGQTRYSSSTLNPTNFSSYYPNKSERPFFATADWGKLTGINADVGRAIALIALHELEVITAGL